MSFHGIFLALICVSACSAKHLSIPLTHHRGETRDDLQSIQTNGKRQLYKNDVYQAFPFWYGLFDIGDSKNLSMLIDSGADNIAIITPDVYIPSVESQAENKTFKSPYDPQAQHTSWIHYDQTLPNGCENLWLWWDGYKDTVSWNGVTIKHQRLAVANKVNVTYKDGETQLERPYQGIVGFAIDAAAEVGLGGTTFVTGLYQQGQIEEPRFGLAFGTSGEGQLVLGGIDTRLFEGDLTVVEADMEWGISNASVTVNGSVVDGNKGIFFDSGGPSINSSPRNVRALFEQSGIEAVETQTKCGTSLYGYYPCDSPPRVGFQIGGKNFDIEPEALEWKKAGLNRCIAIIVGQEGFSDEYWTLGNAFMQGKYIDHFHKTMGFANLKAPAK